MTLGAAQALGQIGDRRAVGPLLKLLEAGDEDERRGAITALAQIKDPSAAVPLASLLKSPSETLRVAAAQALGELEARSSVNAIKARERITKRTYL
jgi:HEAT repeat protein